MHAHIDLLCVSVIYLYISMECIYLECIHALYLIMLNHVEMANTFYWYRHFSLGVPHVIHPELLVIYLFNSAPYVTHREIFLWETPPPNGLLMGIELRLTVQQVNTWTTGQRYEILFSRPWKPYTCFWLDIIINAFSEKKF